MFQISTLDCYVTSSSTADLISHLKIAEEINQIAQNFENGKRKILIGDLDEIKTQDQKYFFGIHKDKQINLDFPAVKTHILQELGLAPTTKIIQVIGDSGRFSLEGTQHGKEFLDKQLKQEELILWGYTGKGKKDEVTYDVNQLVNNWLEFEPKRFKHALANVVDYHTVQAIREWGCSVATGNRNFYLVYGHASFGDDVCSSDCLTDEAICLEGGIQSFRQIVNFISRDIPTKGIYNLRGKNNPDSYNAELGQYLNYFSAGEFLDSLKQAIKHKGEFSDSDVEQFKEKYLSQNQDNTRHLFNPTRKDASTKQLLWDAAWGQFKKEKLWLKLDLCHFDKMWD